MSEQHPNRPDNLMASGMAPVATTDTIDVHKNGLPLPYLLELAGWHLGGDTGLLLEPNGHSQLHLDSCHERQSF